MRLVFFKSLSFALVFAAPAWAAPNPDGGYSKRLTQVKSKILTTEKDLLESLRGETQADRRVKSLQSLLMLQKQERALSVKRMEQLETFIADLESRREQLNQRVVSERKRIREGLVDLYRSLDPPASNQSFFEKEQIEAPRRKVLSRLLKLRLDEMESLKIDLADADQLENRIQEERHELAYVLQDQKEQASLLEFHQKMQKDLFLKRHRERALQLEKYRQLKTAENELEKVLEQFNARVELKRAEEAERIVVKSMAQAEFARLKGKLKFPVGGKVVSDFGRAYDAGSSLYIFKKGIEIAAAPRQSVKAVAGGRVVYSGTLAGYGRVSIVDHGAHYYSLSGHLSALKRRVGDLVVEGDELGSTDESGQPLYFEIRARNVAVNPLQWLSN